MAVPTTAYCPYSVLLLFVLLTACGDGGSSPTTPPTPTPPTPVATSVTVSPTSLSFTSIGATQQFSATVKDQNGATMASATVMWSTSDLTVATPTTSGLVKSVGVGTATITAASGSASATGTVEVTLSTAGLWNSINAGYFHTCGVTTEDAGYCWGDNYTGQLGTGSDTDFTIVPVEVSGGHTWTSINGGANHTCGMTTDGSGYCWGLNDGGQLGNGLTTDISHGPDEVSGGHTWTSIHAGGSHTCGVTTDGGGYCWGDNSAGQLGTGSDTSSAVPVEATGGHTWTSIYAGGGTTCGVTTDGSGYCWGTTFSGQLGNGLTNDISHSPVEVSDGHTWTSINAGIGHTCGVTTDGSGYCWGDNYGGQLGNGSDTGISTVPVEVSGGYTWASINAGVSHTCGVTTDGSGYCWGLNVIGQLGNPSTNEITTVPVEVSGGHAWTSSTGAGYHTCDLTVEGGGYCWGLNETGQVGDGTIISRYTPVKVVTPWDS